MNLRRLPLLIALVAALALPSCGGGDDESTATVRTNEVPSGTTGPVAGTTGGAGATKRKRAREARGGKNAGGSGTGGAGADKPNGGGSGGSGSSGGSSSGGASGGGNANSGGYVPPQAGPGGGRTALQEDLFRQGKIVCRAFPLNVLARENRAPSKRPPDVARAYSENYILGNRPGDRQAVYEGCLAGIQARLKG
jgi:hypothetical protein